MRRRCFFQLFLAPAPGAASRDQTLQRMLDRLNGELGYLGYRDDAAEAEKNAAFAVVRTLHERMAPERRASVVVKARVAIGWEDGAASESDALSDGSGVSPVARLAHLAG